MEVQDVISVLKLLKVSFFPGAPMFPFYIVNTVVWTTDSFPFPLIIVCFPIDIDYSFKMLKIHLGLQMALSSHTLLSAPVTRLRTAINWSEKKHSKQLESRESAFYDKRKMKIHQNLRKQRKKSRDEEWKTGGLHAGDRERREMVSMKNISVIII